MIYKNIANQGVYIYAHDTSADLAKPGDSGQITASISKDGATGITLNASNPFEQGSGVYWWNLTQAETNCEAFAIYSTSTTADIQIDPVIIMTTQFTPTSIGYVDSSINTLDDTVNTVSGNLVTVDTNIDTINTNIGTPVALDGGSATVGSMLTKMADDDGGSTFDATTDSLAELNTAIVAGTPLTSNITSGIAPTGTVDSGTWESTTTDDGIKWQISPTADGLNVWVSGCFGADRKIDSFHVNGYFDSGPARYVNITAFNWNSATYDQISDVDTRMNNASSDDDYRYSLLDSHANSNGCFMFEFTSNSTNTGDNLYLDQITIDSISEGGVSAEEIATAVWTHDIGKELKHVPKYTGEAFYVTPSGSDSNDGETIHEAFLTINGALSGVIAGDRIVVGAGTYSENGIDLDKNGLELICEPGTIITTPVSGTQTVLISANNCTFTNATINKSGQVGVKITGSACTLEDIIAGPSCSTAFDIDGVGSLLRRCFAALPTITGFDLAGAQRKLYDCETISTSSNTIGFHINTGDLGIIKNCNSNGNETAGFQVDSGVDEVMIIDCTSGPGDGTRIDNGTNISWRNFMTSDGISSSDVSSIISSGTAVGWTGSGNVEILTGIQTLSGHINTVSGNIDNIDTELNFVTVSGLTPAALSEIVASGDGANWDDTTSVTTVTVSGYTSPALINMSGQMAGALTEYDPPTRTELTSDIGTVTTAITQASGAITTDISALNDISVADILAGSVDTITLTTLLTELLAAANGKIARSASTYVYKKRDNTTTAFTITTSSANRTRS